MCSDLMQSQLNKHCAGSIYPQKYATKKWGSLISPGEGGLAVPASAILHGHFYFCVGAILRKTEISVNDLSRLSL